MPIRDFDEFLRSIIATLENLGFQYAIGGSVASSCYGEPRSTFDVDISVRLPLEEANRFVQAFQSLGYYADLEAVVDAFIYHQPFNIIDAESGFKADIFLIDPDEPSELEQSAMARRRREVYDPDTGAKTYLYAPEDVIIYKLKYYLFSHTHGRKGRRPRFSGDFPAEAGLPTDFSHTHYISNGPPASAQPNCGTHCWTNTAAASRRRPHPNSLLPTPVHPSYPCLCHNNRLSPIMAITFPACSSEERAARTVVRVRK